MRPQNIPLAPDAISEAKARGLVRIVDDDDALREALRFALEADGWKVSDYGTAEQFFTGDVPSEPGCVILDIRMPSMSGMEAQEILSARGIGLPVIFITGHGDVDLAVTALQEGAIDFIQKPVDDERLIQAIAYGVHLDLCRRGGKADPADILHRIRTLTERELELARLLAAGARNREIAERLGIALRTVEVHRASILKKLRVRKAQELQTLSSSLNEIS